ncbi:bromodomain adjacent to zinc finger domain protein 1A [Leptidea sinapis]|uniref:bromodomain adjacent to zinc finger domain protein 1A n=1 Tax=Leptidea sinapis TaxID=189913 RepID=UPI0021C4B40A|nr:bromodomain adjacent to zinc finger domain protein 1A [Leptidea sinapis]
MPMLKRKAFEKSSVSEYLRDDDEVFHCEITDEIFKDYEEYCERIILVNSMVWTCEMTGKNNLTYAEALDSEKAARKSLKNFPMELRIPILYLASRTQRSAFSEMSEDVFNFVRERFFVGESVEACLEGDHWQEAHILSVTAQKQHPDNNTMLPASAYCYEVEQYTEADSAMAGQIGTAPYERMRRRKGIYSREKNRLFLKQFVEMGPVITIKKSALDKYNIHRVSFDQIFTGKPPVFPPSKKFKASISPSTSKISNPGSASKLNNKSLKKLSPDKKGRQESMDKFLKKPNKAEDTKSRPSANPEAKLRAQQLADKMRQAEEQLRQRKEEEKARKREKEAQVLAYMKEWQKVKDDLELEDHKILPKGTPVEIEGIEAKHFGDILSVLDFVHSFCDVLKAKDILQNDLDLDTFRKALISKEHTGVFSDIIKMFLMTIFSLQEEEAEEYNVKGRIQESREEKPPDGNLNVDRSIQLATKASKWAQTYLGTPLSKLQLDPTTVSEVLRMHLLSSGCWIGARSVSWRQQRGAYSSADDPGLQLRMRSPHILRRLACAHVADLPTDDKLEIVQCLMNQVLSYAAVRDIVEEKVEEHKNLKQTLKTLQINERKREPQLAVARTEVKREAIAKKAEQKLSGEAARIVDEQVELSIEKLKKESEMKKIEFEKKQKELQAQLFEFTHYLGMDRAYNRYWISQRVGGLFVEAGAEGRGPCRVRPVPVPTVPVPTRARDADVLAYVTDLYHAGHHEGSDKENDGTNSRGNSPKKPLAVNGVNKALSDDSVRQMRELMVCTADINTCYVHGKLGRPSWWVFNTTEQLDALVTALNKRGARELDLWQNIDYSKQQIQQHLEQCQIQWLNPRVVQNGTGPAPPRVVNVPSTRRRAAAQASLVVAPDCSLQETLELTLRDHILELEEKVFHGCLGAIKVKDREAWRGTLMLRGYDKQVEWLTWGPGGVCSDRPASRPHTPHSPASTREATPEDIRDPLENIRRYRDPGYYLEPVKVNGIKLEPESNPDLVKSLASALLQVSQGIQHKYIKRPLGLSDKQLKERDAKNKGVEMKLETLERWEMSLMGARSLAAVTLHLVVLEASVWWRASVLLASCRLCRRRTDPDSMLLCDGCDEGHHLYCLRPPLTKVPDGDWFCDRCRPKEKTPRKRRKLFRDEAIVEEIEDRVIEASLRRGRHLLNPPVRQECAPEIHLHRIRRQRVK